MCGAGEIMQRFGWLSRQPEPFRAEVLARSKLCHFEAGTILGSVGDTPLGAYGLVDGVVQLDFANGHAGTIRTPGYWIGEAAALLHGKLHVSIVAKTRIQMLSLPGGEVEQLMLNPEYCRSFAQLTAEHLEEARGSSPC